MQSETKHFRTNIEKMKENDTQMCFVVAFLTKEKIIFFKKHLTDKYASMVSLVTVTMLRCRDGVKPQTSQSCSLLAFSGGRFGLRLRNTSLA